MRHPEMDSFHPARFIPFAVGGGLLLIFLIGCFHVVPPGHRGVSITWGKVDPVARGEGITFKKPFMERVIDVDVRQRTVEGQAAAYSSDLQTVVVSFKALYRIPEEKVVQLLQKFQGDPYLSLVEPRIQEELKQTTSIYRAEELVRSREKIKVDLLDKVKRAMGGMLVLEDIPITNFDFTDELEKAIEQKTIREQEALAKNFELEKARKEAEITIVNAEAEARSVKIKGEAIKFAPDVIDLEIVKRWNGVIAPERRGRQGRRQHPAAPEIAMATATAEYREMVPVQTAAALISSSLPAYPAVRLPLSKCHGRILREPLRADREQPPFNRVAMDGVAISTGAWEAGFRRFRVEGRQKAGETPRRLVSAHGLHRGDDRRGAAGRDRLHHSRGGIWTSTAATRWCGIRSGASGPISTCTGPARTAPPGT